MFGVFPRLGEPSIVNINVLHIFYFTMYLIFILIYIYI